MKPVRHTKDMFRIFSLLVLIVLLLVLSLTPTQAAPTATIIVNTTDDEYGSGAGCSLREAITAANTDAAFGGCTAGSGADTITLPAGTYLLTIAGHSEDTNAFGDLDLTSSITIIGAGADSTIIDAGQLDRVMHVTTSAVVELNGLTLTNGLTRYSNSWHYFGGGVYSSGTLTIKTAPSAAMQPGMARPAPPATAAGLPLWTTTHDGQPGWQASLQSAATGQRQGFPDLESLFTYLAVPAGDRPPPTTDCRPKTTDRPHTCPGVLREKTLGQMPPTTALV